MATHLDNSGTIFNIQNFSVNDGPGIRTIVFLKGCPLHCLWCANPESQSGKYELAYSRQKCIGCGICKNTCKNNAISITEKGVSIHRNLCKSCFDCASNCPSQALHIMGYEKTAEEIVDIVEKDSIFYANSNGGLTLSGGEPLFQSKFAIFILKEAKYRKINCAIETSGFVKWEVLDEACRYLDNVLYDIKSMNNKKHKQFIGVSNELILENFSRMCRKYRNLPVLARTPVIPGFNDTKEDIQEIFDFISQFPNVKYELLPYHRLGEPKYYALGRKYPLGDVKLDSQKMDSLKRQFHK
ncbi:glycyl-radical enzyme activating protein [Clostridium sp. LBM24168]